MRENMLDFYTDYLITSTGSTDTVLAQIFDNSLSHGKVNRFLNKEKRDNQRLWTYIKPLLLGSVEPEDYVP